MILAVMKLSFLFGFFFLLLSSCTTVPSKEEVKRDFLKENPTYVVISINPGEGDGSAVYYYIKYSVPRDFRKYEVEWQYLDNNKGKMMLNHKSKPKEINV